MMNNTLEHLDHQLTAIVRAKELLKRAQSGKTLCPCCGIRDALLFRKQDGIWCKNGCVRFAL